MSLSKRFSYTLQAASSNGICTSQTPSGAGNLTLNGALTSGGTFTVTDKCPKQLAIASSSDLSSLTFTVYGTLTSNGPQVTETITGPNNATVTSTNYYYSITRITISGAAGGALTVGTGSVGCTPFIYLNPNGTEATVLVSLTGTVNIDLQKTITNVLTASNQGNYNESYVLWYSDTNMTGKSSGVNTAQIDDSSRAIRVKINSYSSTPTIVFEVAENLIK